MAIDSLEAATNALMNGDIDVLVTAPINKDEMMKQGFKHAGHTGYFEEKFNKKGLMFLVTESLKLRYQHTIFLFLKSQKTFQKTK
jgi:4-hydroxythreonine-4-phosphate dehydrogenase